MEILEEEIPFRSVPNLEEDFRWGDDAAMELRKALESQAKQSVTAKHQLEALERDQGR